MMIFDTLTHWRNATTNGEAKRLIIFTLVITVGCWGFNGSHRHRRRNYKTTLWRFFAKYSSFSCKNLALANVNSIVLINFLAHFHKKCEKRGWLVHSHTAYSTGLSTMLLKSDLARHASLHPSIPLFASKLNREYANSLFLSDGVY